MLKAIFLFIKAHAVATTITATVVVVGTTSVLVIPQVVENYKLNQSIEANLDRLVSSNFQTKDDVSEEIITASDVDTTKPLTFTIKRIETNYDNGDKLVEFVIVPSYDKDFSKWSKEEKEAYDKAIKESAKMTEEEGRKMQQEEEQNLANAELEVQKIIDSYSESYNCGVCSFRYNSYTKKYDGQIFTIEREKVSDGGYNTKISHGETKEYTREEFRESIYPKMIEKLKNEKEYYEYNYDIESYNKALSNLNNVYHLSD